MLKVTLAGGQTVEWPFTRLSTLTVESDVKVEPTVTQRRSQSWSEVVAVEVVDDAPAGPDPELVKVGPDGLAVAAPSEFPAHEGGGWYLLSNGEKVQGRDHAERAQQALDGAEV